MEIQSILGYSIEKLADLESDDQNVKMGRLREFLEELGDINFQDSMGWSALHLFTMRGWLEGIKLVLNNPDARLDLQTRKCQTALHCGLGHHKLEVVKLLCEDSRMSLQVSVVHSHWSRNVEARLSLVESFRVLLAPAGSSHQSSLSKVPKFKLLR